MTETPSISSQLCPTCGTRLSENATRCLVCGSQVTNTTAGRSAKAVQSSRMPELTLSLPTALGLLVLFVTIGAGLVFFFLRNSAVAAVTDSTATPTATITPTVTLTVTATNTATPEPTSTPEPPQEYTVVAGDNCGTIAYLFDVSVNSIIAMNSGLGASCNIVPGEKLLIPRPTPTATPQPTSTLAEADATDAACEKVDYTVVSGDTLSSIAANYNVTMESIKSYNGLVNDNVMEGFTLIIPLCERKPLDGSTPTPTVPPPYLAPSLLLPMNGAAFTMSNDTITLQWASVGTLRGNEAYAITIEDTTAEAVSGTPRKLVEYVTDTKFIVPNTFRPNDGTPHLIHWWVLPVRQSGTSQTGNPVWEPAGTASEKRGVIWSGTASAVTPTP